MASLASGVIVPSLVNGHISGSGLVNGMMRHSLNGGHAGQGHQRPESRLSVQHRRSARGQLTRQDQQRLQEQQRLPEVFHYVLLLIKVFHIQKRVQIR